MVHIGIYDANSRDSTLYFRHSGAMDELAAEKLQHILNAKSAQIDTDDDTDDPLGSLSDGFNQGTADCIEMYVQSHEQDVLNVLGSLPTRVSER